MLLRVNLGALAGWACCLAMCGLAGVGVSAARAAETEAAALLKLAPDDSNLLLVINVQRLLASKLAQQQNWKEKQDARFMSGAAAIPTWVRTAVVAGSFSPEEGLSSTVTLARKPAKMQFEKVASREGGTLEHAGAVAYVRARRGYFAEVTPGILGVYAPPQRRKFLLWLKDCASDDKTGELGISPFLAAVAEDDVHGMSFAVDFSDLLDPRLEKDPLLASLAGVRLDVDVQEQLVGTLRADFGMPCPKDATKLRNEVLVKLSHLGIELPELEETLVKSQDKSLVTSGPISEETLRQLAAVVIPTVPADHSTEEPATTTSTESASSGPSAKEWKATQHYYQTVQQLTRDLRRPTRQQRSYERAATVVDNFARRIRQLPVTGVIPEVLDYGARTMSRLQAMAASLRGVPMNVDTLEGKITTDVTVTTWAAAGVHTPWGYVPAPWEVHSNEQEIRGQQGEVVAQEAQERDELWQMIDQDTVSVRNDVSTKYGVDLDQTIR